MSTIFFFSIRSLQTNYLKDVVFICCCSVGHPTTTSNVASFYNPSNIIHDFYILDLDHLILSLVIDFLLKFKGFWYFQLSRSRISILYYLIGKHVKIHCDHWRLVHGSQKIFFSLPAFVISILSCFSTKVKFRYLFNFCFPF